MTEADFLQRWRAERPLYEAWGSYVKSHIQELLSEQISPTSLDEFLKIAASPRLKGDDSLVGKAFHRNKKYKNPYSEIEDKVGLRFVVLLTADIRKIQNVIEATTVWKWSLDKDFEAEREAKPLEFVYQSKHYVVAANSDVDCGGILVPAGTPCEIQIRTLLQHAHSELTHDNIYKRDPSLPPNRRVERTVAKSMALIEAVDDYFSQAVRELEDATQTERGALTDLVNAYMRHVGARPHIDKTNNLVLNAYQDHVGDNLSQRLEGLLQKYPFIAERIATRARDHYAYRQPWILLAYLMVAESPHEAAGRWPLTPEELRPVFTDMGKRYPS